MKKLMILASALLLVFGMVGAASALVFTDTTEFTATGTNPGGDLNSYGGSYVNKLEYMFDWVSWTHHFTFDPAAASIKSGELILSLRDDGGYWDFYELGFGWTESGEWDLGEVNSGDYSWDVTASYLADGSFGVTLGSLLGDFYIDKAELKIDYNPVPEPATMVLLGVGLVGMAAVGRKKFLRLK